MQIVNAIEYEKRNTYLIDFMIPWVNRSLFLC